MNQTYFSCVSGYKIEHFMTRKENQDIYNNYHNSELLLKDNRVTTMQIKFMTFLLFLKLHVLLLLIRASVEQPIKLFISLVPKVDFIARQHLN